MGGKSKAAKKQAKMAKQQQERAPNVPADGAAATKTAEEAPAAFDFARTIQRTQLAEHRLALEKGVMFKRNPEDSSERQAHVMKHLSTLTNTLKTLSYKLELAEKGAPSSPGAELKPVAPKLKPSSISGASYYSDLMATADNLRNALRKFSKASLPQEDKEQTPLKGSPAAANLKEASPAVDLLEEVVNSPAVRKMEEVADSDIIHELASSPERLSPEQLSPEQAQAVQDLKDALESEAFQLVNTALALEPTLAADEAGVVMDCPATPAPAELTVEMEVSPGGGNVGLALVPATEYQMPTTELAESPAEKSVEQALEEAAHEQVAEVQDQAMAQALEDVAPEPMAEVQDQETAPAEIDVMASEAGEEKMIIEEPEETTKDGPEEDQTNVRRAAAARKANKAHLTAAQGPEEFISLELTVAEERVAVKLQVHTELSAKMQYRKARADGLVQGAALEELLRRANEEEKSLMDVELCSKLQRAKDRAAGLVETKGWEKTVSHSLQGPEDAQLCAKLQRQKARWEAEVSTTTEAAETTVTATPTPKVVTAEQDHELMAKLNRRRNGTMDFADPASAKKTERESLASNELMEKLQRRRNGEASTPVAAGAKKVVGQTLDNDLMSKLSRMRTRAEGSENAESGAIAEKFAKLQTPSKASASDVSDELAAKLQKKRVMSDISNSPQSCSPRRGVAEA